jgi:CRISPR-associated protein Cmr4
MSPWVIEAVTSVRVGDGHAVGAVDLPVSREAVTGWPVLPGSSLKGALRGDAVWSGRDPAVFGTPDHRGALLVGDGLLLALPVRSAVGGCALLTTPLALARLARAWDGAPAVPAAHRDGVIGSTALRGPARAGVGASTATTFLEDLDLVWHDEAGSTLPAWRARLAERLGEVAVAALCLVHEDLFAHAAATWTELQHRNAVAEDGVVEDRKLFTVERCPPGTLWWTWSDGPADAVARRTVRIGGHRGGGSGRVIFHPLQTSTPGENA